MATSDLVLGIDEAGRGPAVGPLVLAAVVLDDAAAARLVALGVADSKRFGAGPEAHARRAALVREIAREAAFVALDICDVATIDDHVTRGRLNALERDRAARLIDRAPPCARVIADGQGLFAPLRARFPHLEAHDGADTTSVAVAAASLCAKVRRDELFACVTARYEAAYGPVEGGGYGNDATAAWVGRYCTALGALPPEARASWPWTGEPAVFRVGPQPPRQLGLF